jgi:fucose permease
MTVFFFAMVIGRFTGSRLTHTVNPRQLVFGALIVVAVGFPIFWLSQVPILNIVGLFVAGLGVANLFPFILSIATSIASEQANQASARVSMGAGAAILIAPQLAGTIADQIGITSALSITAVLIALALIIVVIANRQSRF